VRLETTGLVEQLQQTRTDVDGKFAFSQIRAGHYLLTAYRTRSLGERGGPVETLAYVEHAVHVTSAGAFSVQLQMKPSVTVTMAATSAAGTEIPRSLRLGLRRIDRPGATQSVAVSGQPVALGTATPGRYGLTISPDDSFWIRAVRVGGVEPAAREITISDDRAVNVDVDLSADRSSLRGRTLTAEGIPHSGWWVALVPADTSLRFAVPSLLRVRPDTEGHYAFPAVPAGGYYLAAFRGGVDWAAPEFAARLKAAGFRVDLRAGQMMVQDITVPATGR
jgi:hypothetical protein